MSLDIGYNQFDSCDRANLESILDKYRPKKICEVGCWAGKTTYTFCKYLKSNLKHSERGSVYCIDHFKGSEGTELEGLAKSFDVKKEFKDNISKYRFWDRVMLYPMSSEEAAEHFHDGFFDMVYIDASHLYEDVKKDINLWLKKVRDGGVMSGHDFEAHDYDEQYINDDFVDGKHHGVIKAVTESFNDVKKTGRIWHVTVA